MVNKAKYAILIFSGSRAEYYILEPLVMALSEEDIFDVTFLLHHNYTSVDTKNLEDKNINLIKLPQILKENDKKYLSKYMHSYVISNIIKQISDFLMNSNIDFDMAIAYADRFETFGFAISTSQSGIPLLHMEAGDITNGGTPDDNVRHSITKLAHLCMSSTKSGVKLLQSFKEENWRIYHSGLLGYASIDNDVLSENQTNLLLNKYSINSDFKILIIATMHPLPFLESQSLHDAEEVFSSLNKLSNKFDGVEIIITSPNSDSGSSQIQNCINSISNKNIKKVSSLGVDYSKFLSLSKKKKIVLLGNSSSIIKEAPFFNCYHVNVGQRQKNRVSSSSQQDVEANRIEIIKILEKIYNSDHNQPQMHDNPYYNSKGISGMVSFILKNIKLGREKLLFKTLK